MTDSLQQGREAFDRRAWKTACDLLSEADAKTPLEPEDCQRLATAASLLGKEAESTDNWARAHQGFLGRGNVERAARCAFWLAFGLLHHGAGARASAWLSRAKGLIADAPHDCAEHGYLLLPAALESLVKGDAVGAYRMFCQAAEIGDRCGDPDLIALARHSRGRVLIRMGERQQGVTLLDEAMVAVDAGEVSPLVIGDVYCSVIEGCFEIYDLRRAQEWTAALMHWCEAQPDLVAYHGQCLVRRSEILQLHGLWPDALDEAQRACERFLQGPDQPAIGAAFYQRAELHRLRGEYGDAEEAFRLASRYGRKLQPGLALLRLAQGQLEAAQAAVRAAMDETHARAARSRLLPACVDIMLAAGHFDEARAAADELAEIAGDLDAPFLHAVAAQAGGSVLLAEGDARAALTLLRRAWTLWQEIEVPYEAARVRVLIGLAGRAAGDSDVAEMELDAARWIFEQLGAGPDLARVQALSPTTASEAAPGGLSPREVQVLRLVASGKTNRAIAEVLCISERTVERHVSNIFIKLDVPSRAAATAYAYEHRLV